MAKYVLSGKAEEDLLDIYFYSFEQFGESQADAYLMGLEERLETLAENPNLGRQIDHIREGYFRFEYVRHSIFYTQLDEGIFVVRVLHGSMDTEEHL